MLKIVPESLCQRCTALCCQYITIEIDKPRSKRAHDDIRWYLLHEGITVLIEKGRWLLKVPTPCREMTADGLCGIYETRPQTCRDYTTENCDYYSEFENWETEYIEIETPEEYAQYLESRKRKPPSKSLTKRSAKRKPKVTIKKKK